MELHFLNPNYHVILIHYPLGVFVLGVILELFSFMWRQSSVRIAARWMILLGALLTLPAAASGIYALHDVQHQGRTMPAERAAFLSRHVWVMSSATILAVLCAVAGLGASNKWRQRLYYFLLPGVLIVWGLMVYGAWYGGETIYRQGTSVSLIRYKAVRSEDSSQPPKAAPVLGMPDEPDINLKNPDERYVDIVKYYMGGELQAHIVFAGVAFAVTMGALGLSIRRLTTLRAADHADSAAASAQQETGSIINPPRRVTEDVIVLRTLNPDMSVDPSEARLPVIRFWFLALLAMAAAGVLGYWEMSNRNFFKIEGWRDDFLGTVKSENIRHFAHLVLAIALVALTLLFALTALVLPRRSIPLMFLGTLLVLVIAAQVWIGVLLTFDRPKDDADKGALFHFLKNRPAAVESSTGGK